MKKLDDGTLEVKGCISFFCVTQIWVEEKLFQYQSYYSMLIRH